MCRIKLTNPISVYFSTTTGAWISQDDDDLCDHDMTLRIRVSLWMLSRHQDTCRWIQRDNYTNLLMINYDRTAIIYVLATTSHTSVWPGSPCLSDLISASSIVRILHVQSSMTLNFFFFFKGADTLSRKKIVQKPTHSTPRYTVEPYNASR